MDAFDARYQSAVIRSLRRSCEQRRLELLVFPGGIVEGLDRSAALRNSLYELAGRGAIDGFILLANTVANQVGPAGLQRFCERLRGAPICSVGLALQGIPSVTVNSHNGVRTVIRHFVADHGYRRIAVIRGPEANTEAEERYAAFRAELRAHGIEHDERYAAPGDFLPEAGAAAVRTLLDERKLPVDAIFACNDYMAMGALEELCRRKSPGAARVAVVGFDDIDEASFTVPALTTVQQPLAELAEAALRCILEQMSGETPVALKELDAVPAFRRSCGCVGAAAPTARDEEQVADSLPGELGRRRERISAELARASRGSFFGISRWESQLLSTLEDHLRGVPGDVFLVTFDRLLHAVQEQQGEVFRFHDVLSVLRRQVLACLPRDAAERRRAEDAFQSARFLIGEATVRLQAERRLQGERSMRMLNDAATELANCVDAEALDRCLTSELRRLGLRRAFIVLYEPGARPGAPRLARLHHSIEHEPAMLPILREQVFPAEVILPDEIWLSGPSTSWVLVPLFVCAEQLGYAMLELQSEQGSFYEGLRAHLSVALWSVGRGREGARDT